MTAPTPPELLPPIAAHKKTLAEQEADFTSEGAPVPGTVNHAAPATPVSPDFVEGREDPDQSKELERQQDA